MTVQRALLPLSILLLTAAAAVGSAADWVDWRGPTRDGVSPEKNLPSQWSPSGENLAWRAPFGGRSTPVVLGDRLFLQNAAGRDATVQERVMCFDVASGKVLWEHRFNVFLSDVPPHRVGWASPAVDLATGHVHALGVGGMLVALSRDGKLLWERSINEDFGLITTHGGRTVSPVIEGDLVIVSSLSSGWGDQARGSNRYFAFDKRTGDAVWVSAPQQRHYDTNYSTPVPATINGMRLLLVGGTDGTIHALKAHTGEPVWRYEVSKRAINNSVVIRGTTAFISHSEENLDTNEMGRIAAIDAAATGDIGPAQVKWSTIGWQGGFPSPLVDGDRLYQIDNGAVFGAFDARTGKQLFTRNLGTIQKASPVLADGKIYVGTENGKFFILRPGPNDVEVLDEDQLGTETAPEPIIGSVAISNGRVYLVSTEALYAIGNRDKAATSAGQGSGSRTDASLNDGGGQPQASHVQVLPTELVVAPGESVRFTARLFGPRGQFLREEPSATWSLEGLRGELKPDGTFVPAADAGAQAGFVKATVGSIAGSGRLRVIPPLPWSENFDGLQGETPPRHWVGAGGKFVLREIDGNKVVAKLADNPLTRRARTYLGPSTWSDYTVQADVRATERRRQMGDAGVIAQRYIMVLFGNSQKIELQSWQPATAMTVTEPFAWKAETWYTMKLRVENLPDGSVRARGKVWPAGEPEPPAWTIEKHDTMPHRRGSPGLYADAPFEVFFDNVKVTKN